MRDDRCRLVRLLGDGSPRPAEGNKEDPPFKKDGFSDSLGALISVVGREFGDEQVARRSGCSALLSERYGHPWPVVAAGSCAESGSLAESAARATLE